MQPLWQKYRDQFPVTQHLVYLNHAAVTPLCRPAADAMQHLAQDALEFGSEHYQKWMETYQGVGPDFAHSLRSWHVAFLNQLGP